VGEGLWPMAVARFEAELATSPPGHQSATVTHNEQQILPASSSPATLCSTSLSTTGFPGVQPLTSQLGTCCPLCWNTPPPANLEWLSGQPSAFPLDLQGHPRACASFTMAPRMTGVAHTGPQRKETDLLISSTQHSTCRGAPGK
jgi:hypothetical protein